jgi:hypothetical protein
VKEYLKEKKKIIPIQFEWTIVRPWVIKIVLNIFWGENISAPTDEIWNPDWLQLALQSDKKRTFG